MTTYKTPNAFLVFALDEQTASPVELYGSTEQILHTYALFADCAEKGQIKFSYLSVKNTDGGFLRDFTNFPPKCLSDKPSFWR